ncbi:MAG: NgoFVII family restriction endonuclease [Prevotellaceae bacterium]|nr:NgoFVII family restriction endonuclease [Prevotellaceae bacterium]MDY6199702.1 NgoFVII family restriction endonuclease [Prevotella sp.]
MELLLTKNPIVESLGLRSTKDLVVKHINKATSFNIATGFITNDSIAELQSIVAYKGSSMTLNLFIGMNYLDGFTKIQYNAINELNEILHAIGTGKIYLSPKALFHGKMYSFYEDSDCIGSFVGSSNLGSFLDKSASYIESDIYFEGSEGIGINDNITKIINCLGQEFDDIPAITKFKNPEIQVLKGYDHVTEVTPEQLELYKDMRTGTIAHIPFKTDPKSNLNTYFGAGKIKNRYSPRGWYEVELILNKGTEAANLLPTGESFTVITDDGYSFNLSRQGDYYKNLRSDSNLKILGRWIKGRMENDGALEIGKPITQETIDRFGKSQMVFEETETGIWLLSMK